MVDQRVRELIAQTRMAHTFHPHYYVLGQQAFCRCKWEGTDFRNVKRARQFPRDANELLKAFTENNLEIIRSRPADRIAAKVEAEIARDVQGDILR